MWSRIIVLQSPFLDLISSIVDGCKPQLIQAFITQFAIETLDEGVLDRSPWADEIEMYPFPVCPSIEMITGKFRAMVQCNHRWFLTCMDDPV